MKKNIELHLADAQERARQSAERIIRNIKEEARKSVEEMEAKNKLKHFIKSFI